MNFAIVETLVYKDWYFMRWAIAGYLLAGVGALALLAVGGEGASFGGFVLLITVIIAAGMHTAMATVIGERTEHTLPFIMTLPISPLEYTTAKIVANLAIFLVPWVTLLGGAAAMIAFGPKENHGVLPFTVITLTELFVGYTIVLAVALITESQAWTVGATLATNLFFQAFLYYVSHHPVFSVQMKGTEMVWSGPAGLLLLAEFATIVLLVVATFYFQSRKKDFL